MLASDLVLLLQSAIARSGDREIEIEIDLGHTIGHFSPTGISDFPENDMSCDDEEHDKYEKVFVMGCEAIEYGD